MEEREREAREQRGKLEADIGSLQHQLLAKNEELQNMEKTVKEVSGYSQVASVPNLESECFPLVTNVHCTTCMCR